MHDMRDAPYVLPEIDGQRTARHADAEVAAVATRQHGVVARHQLVTLGLSLDAIDHRVESGRLLRLHRGVYAVGHRKLSGLGFWTAAVLAAGPGAVLSHRSAGALWRVREWSSRRVDITVPRRRRSRDGLVLHETRLPPDERDEHEGIPVTTPARTLLDLAAVLDEHQLARACERAEALRLTSPTTLQELLDRYPKRPGTPAIRRLIEEGRIVPVTTANDFERRLLTLLDVEDLPEPLVNQPLGHIRPDFRWPEHRLIVELDGFETHGTRAAFERDRARDRALTAQGWRVVRITKRQLDDAPDEVAAQLRTLLTPETTAAPAPPRDRRTPAPRSPRAAR
jgi:very-short-patch-repair endonuclease/predicted transcriptional regulator of viral defense system